MSQAWGWTLLGGAIIIIGVLLFIIFRMYSELHRRQKRQRLEQQQARNNCLSHLDVIGRAMQAGQMDLIEGCLRARVIIDILDDQWWQDEHLAVIAHVSDKTSHLHTHQARSELQPRERMAEDRQRIQVLEHYEKRILVAANRLVERTQHVESAD